MLLLIILATAVLVVALLVILFLVNKCVKVITYKPDGIVSTWNFRFHLYLRAKTYASRPLVASSHRDGRDGGERLVFGLTHKVSTS